MRSLVVYIGMVCTWILYCARYVHMSMAWQKVFSLLLSQPQQHEKKQG